MSALISKSLKKIITSRPLYVTQFALGTKSCSSLPKDPKFEVPKTQSPTQQISGLIKKHIHDFSSEASVGICLLISRLSSSSYVPLEFETETEDEEYFRNLSVAEIQEKRKELLNILQPPSNSDGYYLNEKSLDDVITLIVFLLCLNKYFYASLLITSSKAIGGLAVAAFRDHFQKNQLDQERFPNSNLMISPFKIEREGLYVSVNVGSGVTISDLELFVVRDFLIAYPTKEVVLLPTIKYDAQRVSGKMTDSGELQLFFPFAEDPSIVNPVFFQVVLVQ